MSASEDDWKCLPFGDTIPIAYRASFSADEYRRIAEGLVPGAMEDKWFIHLRGSSLNLHRSWTGEAVYRLRFESVDGRREVTLAECAVGCFSDEEAGYHPRLVDFLVRALLLGEAAPFPLPAGSVEPAPGIYQHVVAGTGHREESAPGEP